MGMDGEDWRKERRRVQDGSLFRFDSITQMFELCRRRYDTNEIQYGSEAGELLLFVALPCGESFESLIIHFEGERSYAVLLPEPLVCAPGPLDERADAS